MAEPFFSIIIPTFNSAGTLVACLKSIVAQGFKDLEIVIIDAESKDQTIEIINTYEKHANITWVSEKDQGIYDGMNKGVVLSKEKWLYFMGSDDRFYDSTVLETISTEIEKTPGLQIIYGDVYSTRFNGIYAGEFTNKKIYDQNICHQAIFLKRAVFAAIGLFNITNKTHADWEHNLRWFLSSKIKKQYINLIIAEYADGGFSSINGDNKFLNELPLKYLQFGHLSLSFRTKYAIWKTEIRKAYNRRQRRRVVSILFHTRYLVF